jgi:DNA anti-recombination protein RmuC
MREETDRRFQEMREETNRRFQEMREETDKRFQDLIYFTEKRFEEVNRRLDLINRLAIVFNLTFLASLAIMLLRIFGII